MEKTQTNVFTVNKKLSSDVLKLTAIFAMLIDHVAWVFVETNSVLGFVMHFIGRFTIPVMCFFIAQGYYFTKSKTKYALRLFLFAIISHVPFVLFRTPSFTWSVLLQPTSVFWTLFLGLLALITMKQKDVFLPVRIVLIGIIMFFALFGDWQFWAVLWILGFGLFHNKLKMQLISFGVVAVGYVLASTLPSLIGGEAGWAWSLYTLGLFLPVAALLFYNSNKKPNKKLKWAFYLFYPLHLLVLVGFKMWL